METVRDRDGRPPTAAADRRSNAIAAGAARREAARSSREERRRATIRASHALYCSSQGAVVSAPHSHKEHPRDPQSLPQLFPLLSHQKLCSSKRLTKRDGHSLSREAWEPRRSKSRDSSRAANCWIVPPWSTCTRFISWLLREDGLRTRVREPLAMIIQHCMLYQQYHCSPSLASD